VLTYTAQNVIDGINNVDSHIGGNELHRRCYNQLQQRWLLWSGGHHVAIQDTTLRGLKIHAAIAGKDLLEPVKEQDAILHFFMKPRGGKSDGMVFRPGQVDLAIVIDTVDYILAIDKRERAYESDENGIAIRHKVCTYDLVLIDTYCSQHSIGHHWRQQQQRTQVK
jgi:hypothetical protein